jgi:hypothetical protein
MALAAPAESWQVILFDFPSMGYFGYAIGFGVASCKMAHFREVNIGYGFRFGPQHL